MLIDSGEGAQIKMAEFKIKRSKIDHIFISHLHGDHIFGLPGVINSFGLNGRKNPLHIYGPHGLREFILSVAKVTGGHADFEVDIQELDGTIEHDLGILGGLNVSAFPMKHRIPTLGYRFDEAQRPLKINTKAIAQYQLTVEEIKLAKTGASITRGGEVILSESLTLAPRPLRSFAYCSDTIYDSDLIPYIQKVDLLYHEATYLHELATKARERMHSTAHEAALIAKDAAVGRLAIGHYSGRYKDLSPLLKEAQETFADTDMAVEGKVFEIGQ